MKKIFAALLVSALLVCLTACGGNSSSSNSAPAADTPSSDSSQVVAGSGSAVAPSADAQQITINLLGEDVPVNVSLGDGTFTVSYSFNGNDVVASGTMDDKGMMTLSEYTPSDVPDMYVQGALDLIAEELLK